ncbi:hypothetical protein ACNFCJ_21000 [Pseudomonas sp. NY15364]|uniref:hypothetical protein n=1 Tax=Pseudomonas sp. NY15364 TaxID=3400353 RepID=UPI003A84D1B6
MIKLFATRKTTKSPFSEFIRNAKSDEKKRVYNSVITAATKRQQDVMNASVALKG